MSAIERTTKGNNYPHSLNSAPTTTSSSYTEVYLYALPLSITRLLCDYLDELNVWDELAILMAFKPIDIQEMRRKCAIGKSPCEELLNIWGGQYNHTVNDLLKILRKYIKLYSPSLFVRQRVYYSMLLLKKFVHQQLHVLIANSQPALSELEANAGISHAVLETVKELNCTPSQKESNSNNCHTNDNNYTTSHCSPSNNTNEQHQAILNSRSINEYASSIPEIKYIELTDATNNWSDQHILGKGGFGTVYHGYWKHSDVAIKQICYRGANGCDSAKIQLQQSLNELKYLNSCRHDNVLPLYGYSIKGEKPCLVYQLMKGGSLEQRLYTKKVKPLTWQERIHISLGTARGINYLHTFREKPLIHGDIKPANVLLDHCLNPKIGDFGLAREGPTAVGSTSAIEVTQIFGTKPYLPPEFLNCKKLSTQVDTYSFGVVLLETFTGMRAYDKTRVNPLLTRHILKLYAAPEFSLKEHIDDNVTLNATPAELDICIKIIQLAINCIAEQVHNRPDMESVLKALYICV